MAGGAELSKTVRPNVSLVDKVLLGSWVYSYSLILWCFKLLNKVDSARVAPPTQRGASRS
jgi:hypothetical protein